MVAASDAVPGAGQDGASSENAPQQTRRSLAFLSGGGELGAMVRAYDWSKTPLGPPQHWPQNLRTAVSTCLGSSFGIVIWWGRDLILLYNDPYISMLANKHPRALGQKGEECWAEVWPLVGPMLQRVLDQGTPFTADDLELMVWRHGYFEESYFCFSYSPIYDADGNVSGVFCPVIETTDKIIGARRLETLRELAALRRAETLEAACQQAVAILAKNGRDVPFAFLYMLSEDGASATLMAATDGSRETAGRPIAQITEWPIADALAAPRVLENLARKGLPTGSWSEPPLQAYLAPVVLLGSQKAWAVLVAGVSPHKRLDQSYQAFLELLVAQVGSTIADTLAYEAERKRAEALAEIDRAKTLFFSNISHEFRTPLTLMLGPLEDALSDPQLPATDRDRLEISHRNGVRLLKLVNSLLEFSRIEAGRAQASYEPTELAMLTIDLASNFRSACEKAGLELIVDCPTLAEPVHVDRDMWEKIVLNLLSNAFKFTLEGRIEVRLSAVPGHALLTVRDTGVGVPPHELPRLFERFHRIEGQISRTHEGTGIGLALVQELVKLHGGTISADSEVGRGTNFTVQIPLGTAHLPKDRRGVERSLAPTSIKADAYVQEALRWLPDTPASVEPLDAGASEPYTLDKGSRILVADDNADMRAYVRGLLGNKVEVETVADGEAALDAMHRRRPDLVLADVMMPRLDGFGLLKAIRADENLRDIPVIMVSARAGEESKIEGLDAGADDYLVKPFSGRELLARISTNLALHRVRREAGEKLRESEGMLRLLLAELQHRVRNILATVRSIANRTGKTYKSLDEFQAHFDGRLSALGRTQGVLIRAPGIGVDLENLIREELLAQAAPDKQFLVAGPSIRLAPKAAEVLTLAIHELATNSTKYGALAQQRGLVEIGWKRTEQDGESWLLLDWTESGIRMPGTKPARKGFGTELITRRIPHELHGEGSLEFEKRGVRARVSFPLQNEQSVLEAGFTAGTEGRTP